MFKSRRNSSSSGKAGFPSCSKEGGDISRELKGNATSSRGSGDIANVREVVDELGQKLSVDDGLIPPT
jgi:hypothetical protein